MEQQDFYNQETNSFIIHKEQFWIVDQMWIKHIDTLIHPHKNKIILDYWCGNWEIAIKHLKMWANKVIWVDISKKLIQIALEKTIEMKNIEFMSIDDNNVFFDAFLQNESIDTIVSYYVLCTIPKKEIIESLAKSFFKKLKKWWSFITLLPNRDWFNGKECYWFSYIFKNNLKEWDEVVTYLRTNHSPLPNTDDNSNWHLRLIDYFWPQKVFLEIFSQAGFKVTIDEIFASEHNYDWIKDEKEFSPMYVMSCKK